MPATPQLHKPTIQDFHFHAATNDKEYRECTHCVMDTSDPEIQFDDTGRCNHCSQAELTLRNLNEQQQSGTRNVNDLFRQVQQRGQSSEYDAVIGLSGGADSSYLAKIAHESGLRVLAVHLDNGWNSELAVQNIEAIVDRLKIALHTHVVDWQEFRDLQLSFMKANVVDIEMLTDHAIWACLYQTAAKYRVPTILLGTNRATECILPNSWVHSKWDGSNIRNIHHRCGNGNKIRTYPLTSSLGIELYYTRFRRISRKSPLDYMIYEKSKAMSELEAQLQWRPYEAKHYESTFTRFYQAYILPRKFGIDKRRAHLSSLVVEGSLTRSDASERLKEPLYRADQLSQHIEFVQRKFEISPSDFDAWLDEPPVPHDYYGTEERSLKTVQQMKTVYRYIKRTPDRKAA